MLLLKCESGAYKLLNSKWFLLQLLTPVVDYCRSTYFSPVHYSGLLYVKLHGDCKEEPALLAMVCSLWSALPLLTSSRARGWARIVSRRESLWYLWLSQNHLRFWAGREDLELGIRQERKKDCQLIFMSPTRWFTYIVLIKLLLLLVYRSDTWDLVPLTTFKVHSLCQHFPSPWDILDWGFWYSSTTGLW